MKARDIMSHPVLTVRTSTPIRQAAGLLAGQGFTAVPVLDDDGRLVGIVTEADLLRDRVPADPRLNEPNQAPATWAESGTVGAVMSTPVESLTPGEDAARIERMMAQEHIRAVPIVDGGRVVGIVTRRDLLRATVIRDDADLAADIREQLTVLPEPDRWTVTVQGGVADIEDFRDDADDRALAQKLAAAVPGVVLATTRHQTPDPS